jgi:hypothetical protein
MDIVYVASLIAAFIVLALPLALKRENRGGRP